MSTLPGVPSALKLRERFDRNAYNRVKVTVTHAELLELCRDLEKDFPTIAKALNAKSPSSALAYYNRYVRPLLGLSGQDRQRERLRLKREALRRKASEEDPVIEAIEEAASKAGLEVARVHMQGIERKPLTHMFVRVGGILCQVHPITRVWSPARGKRYAQISFRRNTTKFVLGEVQVHLFVVMVGKKPRIWVVPTFVLNRIPGTGPKVKGWIPLHKPWYRANQKHRIPWESCENDWDRLKGEER